MSRRPSSARVPDWIDQATFERVSQRFLAHTVELPKLAERADVIVSRLIRDLLELQTLLAEIHRLAGTVGAMERVRRDFMKGEADE